MRFLISLLFLLLIAMLCHAQLMEPAQQASFDRALPMLSNGELDDALHGRSPGKRLFYTGKEIPHAQQDTDNGRMVFHLSSHNRSANKDGKAGTDDEFPWKNPGGTDTADGSGASVVYAWKVMYLPPGKTVLIHTSTLRSFFAGDQGRTFFGGSLQGHPVRGYDWTFPDGTIFFELLSFKDRLRVFEVRVRSKIKARWRVNVFRPFPTREEFMAEVGGLPEQPKLRQWSLTSAVRHRDKEAFNHWANIETIPGFQTAAEADEAIDRPFRSCFQRNWAADCAAPTTEAEHSIIPKGYSGAFVGNSAESCARCHQDAATHLRFFDQRRQWYGFIRGSFTDKILSFHPVALASISPNGTARPVAWRQELIDAGIIELAAELKGR